jgi:hypothetical protein
MLQSTVWKRMKKSESPFELFLPRLMINTPKNTPTESFVRKLVEGEDLDNWEPRDIPVVIKK